MGAYYSPRRNTSVADYNSTRVGVVVVVVVVVNTFLRWNNLSALSYQVEILHSD